MRTADTDQAAEDRTYILGMMAREGLGEDIGGVEFTGESADEVIAAARNYFAQQ